MVVATVSMLEERSGLVGVYSDNKMFR